MQVSIDGEQGHVTRTRSPMFPREAPLGARGEWITIYSDAGLIRHVMDAVDCGDVEMAGELAHNYQTSVDHYNETGEDEFLETACDYERGLRVLLARARLRNSIAAPRPKRALGIPC